MSRQPSAPRSQITETVFVHMWKVRLGPNWANKRQFSHLFSLKSAHANKWSGGKGSKEGLRVRGRYIMEWWLLLLFLPLTLSLYVHRNVRYHFVFLHSLLFYIIALILITSCSLDLHVLFLFEHFSHIVLYFLMKFFSATSYPLSHQPNTCICPTVLYFLWFLLDNIRVVWNVCLSIHLILVALPFPNKSKW